jgi:hypothetical protein
VNNSASTLQVKGGSQVSTGTFGAGKGGNLTVDVQVKVSLVYSSEMWHLIKQVISPQQEQVLS